MFLGLHSHDMLRHSVSFPSHPTHYSNQFLRQHVDVPFGLEFQPDALI